MPEINSLPPEAPRPLLALEHADLAVAEKAGGIHDHPLVEALGGFSEMADQPPLIALSIGTLAAGLLLCRPRLAVAGARMIAAHGLATGMKTVLKRSIDRTRPRVLAEEREYIVRKGRRNEPRYNSFPSGHTAGAVAVAEAIARTHPAVAWTARGWAAMIAAIQIPRCTHYPSDIAAGAAIGWGADRLVRLAERGLRAWAAR